MHPRNTRPDIAPLYGGGCLEPGDTGLCWRLALQELQGLPDRILTHDAHGPD